MKNDNTLYYEVTALPGSDLEKAVTKLLQEGKENQKRLQDNYKIRIEKQRRKVERSRV